MQGKISKIIAIILCISLLFQQTGFTQVAGELDIAGHIAQLRASFIQDKFRPLHLRYLAYDTLNNNFKLLLDKGDFMKGLSPSELSRSRSKGTVPEEHLKDETRVLLNYFFVGSTLPNDSFWVNLKPDSPDNIIDSYLAQTDVGKILLEADLQLKKDTAQFTSPQTAEGRTYWTKLYKKAEELFGYENITIPTLTRPWIVPGEIIIRETQDNAYIYKATLKVMLEQDYLKDSTTYNFKDERLKTLNEYSSQLIREKILPNLIKEVNTAKRYAPLRQVYYSLILAQWFKSRFYGKGGLYSWLIDKKNLRGLTSATPWSKSTYFKEYQKSFKQGEYNLKEPAYAPFGQTIRSYMSGGIAFGTGLGGEGGGIGPALEAGEIIGSQKKPEPSVNSPIIKINLKGATDLANPYEGLIVDEVILPRSQPALPMEEANSVNSPMIDKKASSAVGGEGITRRDFLKDLAATLGGLAIFGTNILRPSLSLGDTLAYTKQHVFFYDPVWFTHYLFKEDDNLPKLPKSLLWWFASPLSPHDFKNDTLFLDALMSQARLEREPILPITKLFYAFPILTAPNTKISGSTIQKYFQSSLSQKELPEEVTVDKKNTKELLEKIPKEKLAEENIKDLRNFVTVFFETLPLHLIDYVERIDEGNGVSRIHFHLKQPIELNVIIKGNLLKKFINLLFMPDVSAKIRWERDIYIDFRIFSDEEILTHDRKTKKAEVKTVAFYNMKGFSINVSRNMSWIAGLIGRFASRFGFPIDVSVSDLVNIRNWYFVISPDGFPDSLSDELNIERLKIFLGLPNKKSFIPADSAKIEGLYLDVDKWDIPYVVLSSELGAVLEETENLDLIGFIYGEDQLQRVMRIVVMLFWLDDLIEGLKNN